MSARAESEFSKKFHSHLAALRLQANEAPEVHRAMLHAFADQIEQLHRQMQDGCSRIFDAVDDISLAVASAKFHVWACQQDADRSRGLK